MRSTAPRLVREAAALAVAPLTARAFIPAVAERELAFLLGNLAPPERAALAAICETADLLLVDGQPWLLVPATPRLIDILAGFNAEAEDLEPCLEDEPNPDGINRFAAQMVANADLVPECLRPPRRPRCIAIPELTPAKAARLLAKRER